MGAWAGGVAQLKLGREAQRDTERANRDLTRRMEASRREYEALRPANSLSRQHALQNMLSLYGPANEMLGEMTGGRFALDLQQPTRRWPDMAASQQQTQPVPQAPPPLATSIQKPTQPLQAPGWGGVGGTADIAQIAGVVGGRRR